MPVFAEIDSGWLCGSLIILAFVVPAIIKGLEKAAKAKEEADLKSNNPELWLRKQQMEHEKQVMEHEEKIMRHESMKTGVGIGAFILRIFMKD